MLKMIDKSKVTQVINPHELQASMDLFFTRTKTKLAFIKVSL